MYTIRSPCIIKSSHRWFSSLIPYVIEKTNTGERAYDIYSRLLKDRIVCLHGSVDTAISGAIISQFLFLESIQPDKPISFYINSPGGSVPDGLAIYDTMRLITCPIHTYCIGMAASMGSLLLAAGEKGHRYILPNAQVMIHQPHGGTRGQASDIAIHAKEILRIREQLNQIYSFHTGQSISIVEKAMERDNYMTPQESLSFGLVDKIATSRKSTL